jgi:hypothetical protein
MDIYESSADVTFTAANYGQVTTDNINLKMQKSTVNLKTFNLEGIVAEASLFNTRAQKSMAAGAFNVISDEFDKAVLTQVMPAGSAKLEVNAWHGATAETKAAIAALTPGAGQGSISASAQALVAAMPTTFFDSIIATVLYNNSNSKATAGAGLGDYRKVLAPVAVTQATIVSEYVKIFNTVSTDLLNSASTGDDEVVIFAPKEHYRIIMNVNKVQGAALQDNFTGTTFTDMAFNNLRIIFTDMREFVLVGRKSHFKLVMDLLSDSSQLIVEKEANASTNRIFKMINTMNTWVIMQKWNVLYGG